MRRPAFSASVVAALFGCLAAPFTTAQEIATAPRSIVVVLRDGRTVAGELDPQTDADRLWVRRAVDAVVLRSGFAWLEIDGIVVEAETVPPEKFRQQALSEPIPPGPEDQLILVAQSLAPPLPPAPVSLVRGRVRTLEIRAYSANWDGDAESDGLRLHVMPLDDQGRIVPVDGQLDSVLIGQDVRRSYVLDLQPPEFPELGRWSHTLRAVDFGEAGAIVELPYSSRHPEFDRHLLPDGLLTVRLGVAGQGVFDASDDWVWLRPFSIIRDQLQFVTRHRRSVPAENILQRSEVRPTRTPNRRADDRAR